MNESNPPMRELASTDLDLDREEGIELPEVIPLTPIQRMPESGQETSKLATRYFNYTGLKWRPEIEAGQGRDDGGAARPVTYDGQDGQDGQAESCRLGNPEDSIFGYWPLIGRSLYRGYEAFAGDPEGQIRFLNKRHHAEDPRSVRKVLDLPPDEEGLADELAGSNGRDRAGGGRRRHRANRGSRRAGVRKDAVYLHGGPQGLVEEWEQGDLVADAETRGDIDELIDFLDTTEVAEYVVTPGADTNPEPRRSRRSGRGRRRDRPSRRRRREDGVYIYSSADGRVEEWENGELVADAETDGDLDLLLGFLDQTWVQNYFLEPRGRISRPTGEKKGQDLTITEANIKAMSRHAADRIVKGIVDNQEMIIDGGIDSPLRMSHFMAQLAHESAHFGVTLEFASGRDYEGRRDLGNTRRGDGPRYRGRGLIQTTGRANYREARDDIRKMIPDAPDFEADPEELEEFPWALLSAISYWRRRNLNRLADRDDVVSVTKRINGGATGLNDRKRYLAVAKTIWTGGGPTSSAANPTLRSGDKGEDVKDLQFALVEAGFAVDVDGHFGKHTREAVKDFQESQGVTADGVVGPNTWAMLDESGS